MAKHFSGALKGGKRAHVLFENLLGNRVAADYRVGSLGKRRAVESVNMAREVIQAIEDELVRRGAIPRG